MLVADHMEDELASCAGDGWGWWSGCCTWRSWGNSQEEGAGLLEPTEGLEKPPRVLALPWQSFEALDDLVMQIAKGQKRTR